MTTRIGTDIVKAAHLLNNSELVAIPTETVYGLAANGFDVQAVEKIYTVKERPSFNPLILHFPDKEKAMQVVESCPSWAEHLMHEFWPGPLTLVLPKKAVVPSIITAGKNTVAVRVPQHAIMLDLLRKLEFPLAAPSANLFGHTSPTRPEHVLKDLNGRIPYILDGGFCECGIESTIIGVGENSNPFLLRAGALDVKIIERAIGKISSFAKNDIGPVAPGMLDKHYAPSTPAYLVENISAYVRVGASLKLGVLLFNVQRTPSNIQVRALSERHDLREAASNLYAMIRELDALNLDVILFEKLPEKGIGGAINDKLLRASKSEEELKKYLKHEFAIIDRKPF
jgi:L-threonylcarbamoyladenylate synthase